MPKREDNFGQNQFIMFGQSRYKEKYREGADFFEGGPRNKKEWKEFQRYKRMQQSPQAKFYKHFTWYLAIMGFLLFENRGNIFSFYPIAFFWGAGVVMHYFSVFEWPNDQKDEPEEELDEEVQEPIVKKPNWSDKDLV